MTDKTAATSYPVPVPKDKPCPLCGGDYFVGKHLIRASGGEKCRAPGCKAKLFEKCEVDGAEVASKCLAFVAHVVRTA